MPRCTAQSVGLLYDGAVDELPGKVAAGGAATAGNVGRRGGRAALAAGSAVAGLLPSAQGTAGAGRAVAQARGPLRRVQELTGSA